MNSKLVDFLSGQKVIAVKTADDMKHFVDWLNKYDIYDILVANKNYEKEYKKISFWKDQAKQIMERQDEWIHTSLLTIYFHFIGYITWYYKWGNVYDEFGTTRDCCVIEAKDL